jgi:hypothetical protein
MKRFLNVLFILTLVSLSACVAVNPQTSRKGTGGETNTASSGTTQAGARTEREKEIATPGANPTGAATEETVKVESLS